jgi:hypothetical protein
MVADALHQRFSGDIVSHRVARRSGSLAKRAEDMRKFGAG